MSVEKFIALYLPLKVRDICTVKTAKWVSGITFMLYALYNSQFFVTSYYKENYMCLYNEPFDNYVQIFARVDGVLYSYVPIVIIGTANIAIIYKFIKAKLATNRSGTGSTSQAMSSAAMRGTAILISVSVAFLVLTTPPMIMWAVTFRPPRILVGATFLMQCTNHSINSVLYCVVGTKLRKEMLDRLCWFRQRNVDKSDVSLATKTTSVSAIVSTDIDNSKTALP